MAAGVGGHVEGFAGATVDARYAPPIKLSGIVESIEQGDQDAVIGYLEHLEPELYAMKADWFLALTPGGVDQKMERVLYKKNSKADVSFG